MKYREFWIRYESILPGYGCKEKHAFETEQTNSFHVIEFIAYEASLSMLEEMAAALEMIERAYPLDGDRMAHQDVALKMLDKYKQWKAGE